jgi:hypothetical protein
VGTSENFHKIRLCSILAGKSHPYMYNVYIYSHPQTDGTVNHHQISRDLLFHLFGDDYIYINCVWMGKWSILDILAGHVRLP